jgi:anionic cell wall polymer biosynthesis LytR-Cps2A-Psr (LCP) family protein
VPSAIHDHQFPTDDYGIMTFAVEPGRQHMDGLTALRYARTRNQDNDIERIRRQQLILLAIRDKVLSANAMGRAPEIYDAIAGSVETDMSLTTVIAYGLAGGQIDRARITTHILDNAAIDAWVPDAETGLAIPRRPKIAPLIAAFMAGL